MYKKINYTDASKAAIEQIQKGAFLTVKSGEKINTMTIGWGSIGFAWGKPVFTVLVRYSRYTYELIEKAEDFTVSIPLKGQLKSELAYCGTKSGKDVDKFKECNLDLKESQNVKSPIIDNCDLHFECKIIFKQPMDENNLAQEIKDKSYSSGNLHVIYYGEILNSYIKE